MTDVIPAQQKTSPAPGTPALRSEWKNSFGTRWWIDLSVMALIVFCFGAVRPLGDPDLPMHLAVGEWIARHRAVPFAEPFAWTRAGAPYYAYSWLPQTIFYLVFDHIGHVGLRALQGMLVLSTAVSAVFMARCAGWRPSIAVILAGLNVIIAAFFVAMLRPQSLLLITIPVIWGLCFRIARGEAVWTNVAMLLLASAVTANTHLFFVLTMAPVVLLWIRPPARRAHSIATVVAIITGWCASPYSLRWLSVFRSNFAPNALLRPPSAISELQPGFVAIVSPSISPMLVLVVAMVALPWVLAGVRMHPRERLVFALYWCVGIIGFGYATRLFVVWWLLSIVPVGWGLLHLTRNTDEAAPRAGFRILGLLACILIIVTALTRTRDSWALEGTTVTRTLPTVRALPAERLAHWLEANTKADARGKLLTSFTYGSYLTWRLPRYSASIDSRTIFPDSVAAAEALFIGSERDIPIGPWRSADLAINRTDTRIAAVLDTAREWRRVATVAGSSPTPVDSSALWVNLEWWRRSAVVGPR